MKRLTLFLSFLALFPSLLFSHGFEAKFVHFAPPTHPIYRTVDRFKILVNEMSGGSLRITNFGYRLLGDERDKLSGLLSGRFQLGAFSTSLMANLIPSYIVCDMPFLWPGKRILYRVLDGFLAPKLFELSVDKGLVGLAWFDNDFRVFSDSVKPIRSPSDMKGLRMRTIKNQIYVDTYRVLGAEPVTDIPFQKLFSSLAGGDVDGQDSPISVMLMAKLTEVQRYVTVSWWSYMGCPVFANARWFNSLPKDLQDILRTASYEAQVLERGLVSEDFVDNLRKVVESGVEVIWLRESSRKAFRKAVLSVYKRWTPFIGKNLIDELEKEIGR